MYTAYVLIWYCCSLLLGETELDNLTLNDEKL